MNWVKIRQGECIMKTSILSIRRSLAGIWSSARRANGDERGAALIMALLMMALMLALTMGISLTAISELGVSNTYGNQTQAFEAAEAGLYHGLNLVRNFDNHSAGGSPSFTKLLLMRPTSPPNPNYLLGNNPFIDSSAFASGATMITDAVDAGGHTILNASGNPVGHQLVDANGNAVPNAYYSVHLIDDEPSAGAERGRIAAGLGQRGLRRFRREPCRRIWRAERRGSLCDRGAAG